MKFLRRGDDDITSGTSSGPSDGSGFNLTSEIQLVIAFAVTFILGLCLAVTVVIPFVKPAPAPQVEPTAVVDTEVPTAREAYAAATDLIRQTDAGAMLVSVSGQWTPNIDMGLLDAGRTGWTYFYYLPSSAEMATVTVGRGKTANVVTTTSYSPPPDLVDVTTRWRIDSNEAVTRLETTCADQMAASPEYTVTLKLTANSADRAVLWHAQVLDPGSQQVVCEVNVEGTTGQSVSP